MRRFSVFFALLLCACPDSDDDNVDAGRDVGTDGSIDSGQTIDAGLHPDAEVDADAAEPDAAPEDGGTSRPEDCDPLQPEVCALPWPSNLYLIEDPARATGYTLVFGETSLPANRVGDHVDPEPYRRMDGYGLGTPILMLFPNLDFGASELPDENDIEASLAADAPVILYQIAPTQGRVPYFAELDGFETDPARRTLIVRPAVILEENARYIVAVRGLVDTDGNFYEPSAAFAELRSGAATDPLLVPRQVRFTQTIQDLSGIGIDPDSLQLAWDFNTASSDALHGRLLAMRDDALARAGAMGPELTITSTIEYTTQDDPDLWFRVEGTMTVPSYLRTKSINFFTHTVLNLNFAGVPEANGTRTAPFWLNVPRSVMSSTTSHGLILYGHGLLGSGEQALSSYNRPVANRYHYIYGGANLTGFSEDDQLATASAVSNMSGFEGLADTMHQGIIEYLLLARAMRERLPSHPFFTGLGANIDPARLHYKGISQGGIFGGTVMAIATDFTRGHLGVPGQNYSTLLPRSVDFAPFFEMMATAYGDSRDHQVLIAAAQLLWDGTDPVSYYRHITADPFPDTPMHQVLLAPAKGDWQVAVLTTEIIARTGIGVMLMENYDDERTPFGIVQQPYPYSGSGIVLYDHGNPWPPAGNLPPMDGVGDPHGLPRRLPAHNEQLDHFLRTGEIIDTCGGDGCNPD